MEVEIINETRKHNDTVHLVAPGVICIRIAFVNVFLVGDSTNWVLIDAGLGGYSTRIRNIAEEYFGMGTKPRAVLLTHGHFDHIGALKELLFYWDVPVYAHRMESPFLTGLSHYPPPDPSVGGGLMSLMSWSYPSSPIDLGGRLEMLPEDGSVPFMSDWTWIHTPGHTAGHVSFFRRHDSVLIAGDALTTVKQESAWAVLRQRQEMHGPPAYFTSDWQAAGRSVQKLAALNPMVVASGHGLPMRGQIMTQQLETLALNFEMIAVPRHGRYVMQPARTDERGIVLLPPPVDNTTVKRVALGAGVAVITAGLVYAILSSKNKKKNKKKDKMRKMNVEIEYEDED